MFECDRQLRRLFHEPLYNIQWYTITKDGQVYCLVPVPFGKDVECLARVDEMLVILNRHTRCWKGGSGTCSNQPTESQTSAP